jgi:D-xylose transport system substrate-binding protein
VVNHVPVGSTIGVIEGEQECTSCVAFKVGAYDVLNPLIKAGKIKVGYEADTLGWSATTAQTETEEALTKLHNKVSGFVVANDALAGGVIAALKEQGLAGKVVVTGQDSTIAGLDYILQGYQSMSIYKNFDWEAIAAAKAAYAMATGKPVPHTTKVNNGKVNVPSTLFAPQVLTKQNMMQLGVDSGYTTVAAICKAYPGKCPL